MSINFSARILLAVVFASIFAGQLPAQSVDFDITGIWRDENANTEDATTPAKEVLPNQPLVNNNFHGTYLSKPYLLISLQDKTKPQGPYYIYSDAGDLRAEMQPLADKPNDYNLIDRRSGKNLGVLRINGGDCDGRPACFSFVNASPDLPVPAATDGGQPVLYVPVGQYDPKLDPKQPQKFGDMFAPLSANFGYILKCWNLARMDPVNYQVPGCGRDVFAQPPGDSFGYRKVGFGNGRDAAVPFAWTYVSTLFENGEDHGHTWENGEDIAQADMLKVGIHVETQVFGVSASSHLSVSSQKKIDEMYSSHLTYSKAEYLSTQFAFVLHKYYASLDWQLKDRIALIKQLPEAQRANEYDRFVSDYGTHYANAITFGSKGERQLRMTQSEVVKLREAQTDVSVGISAGYAGSSAGVDVDTSKKNMDKITSATSSEDRSWFCYSGGHCDEGKPTGDSVGPVQLDLRPISDLLAPPFFTDDEIITTMRDGVSRAIAKQAFVQRDNLQLPSAVFVDITNFPRHNLTVIGSNKVTCWQGRFAPRHCSSGDPLTDSKWEDNECGISTQCNDGIVTLSTSDGTTKLLPGTFAEEPTWQRVPAKLVPSGSQGRVSVDFTWSGKCLNSETTYTNPVSASTVVSLPDLKPQGQAGGGIGAVASASCVTDANPAGFVTVLTGSPSITKVQTAKSLLEGP